MNYAISAGHDITADAAVDVLEAGGNAFDAAIAALFAAFVAEPCMASGGGGGFANVYTADHESIVFDFFCQTPRHKRPVSEVEFYPVELDFGDKQEVYHVGKGSSGTPGSIAGIFALHEALGTMPMRELVQPAIQAAAEGVVMNDFQYLDMNLLREILAKDERAQTIFFKDGAIKPVGEKIYMQGFADYLDYLSREGRDAFYRGEVAQKMVADYRVGGGYLQLEDLKNYEVKIRKGLQFIFRRRKVITNPAPASGGLLLALSLNALPNAISHQEHLGTEHVEMWRRALAATRRAAGDLWPEARDFRTLLDKLRASLPKKHGSTTHFNIVDRWNNAISLTTTNGEGSGYFIEGTDIQMNNMLGESALVPEGFHNWPTDVRLTTMMSPTIVLNDQREPIVVLGSGGASRIPFALAQVIQYLADYPIDAREAVNAPRVHLEDQLLNVEYGFDYHINEQHIVQEIKRWKEASLFFGGVHALISRKGQWIAAADARRDGVVRQRNA